MRDTEKTWISGKTCANLSITVTHCKQKYQGR